MFSIFMRKDDTEKHKTYHDNGAWNMARVTLKYMLWQWKSEKVVDITALTIG